MLELNAYFAVTLEIAGSISHACLVYGTVTASFGVCRETLFFIWFLGRVHFIAFRGGWLGLALRQGTLWRLLSLLLF